MAKKVVLSEGVKSVGDPMIDLILSTFVGAGGMGEATPKRPAISSGCLGLDLKLGGGIPRDRVIEYFGPPGSLKTTMALIGMKSFVDTHGYETKMPFIVDMERTIDLDFVAGFGLDPRKILFLRPRSAEDALSVTERLLESTRMGFGIFDSIDACETSKEMARDLKDNSMAELPRLLARMMRGTSKVVVDSDCGIIFINQVKASMNMYGPPETTSGGSAIPYYASMRVRFQAKPSKEVEGSMAVKAKIKKNKIHPLIEAECDFEVIPGKGVIKVWDYVNVGKELGVLKQGGAWYYLMDEKGEQLEKFQGTNGIASWLETKDNADLFELRVREEFTKVSGSMISVASEEQENSLEVEPMEA